MQIGPASAVSVWASPPPSPPSTVASPSASLPPSGLASTPASGRGSTTIAPPVPPVPAVPPVPPVPPVPEVPPVPPLPPLPVSGSDSLAPSRGFFTVLLPQPAPMIAVTRTP
jgi:homeobox protein ESX1